MAMQIAAAEKLPTVKLRLKWFQRIPFFIRLFKWEYWSFAAVYSPIYFYWFYLSAKARSFFFFAAANPSIEYGGFLMECKSDIYKLMPPAFYPKTVLVHPEQSAADIIERVNATEPAFPLIVKPDIGAKGKGVKKVHTMEALLAFVKSAPLPMLVQEYIPYTTEAGIFYYRYPWQEKGHISGIVAKTFLTVTGDGTSSLLELLNRQERYILQVPALQKLPDLDLAEILQRGVKKVLVPFGNHARGALFTDASNAITPALEAAIDKICKQIPGFYYGRMDIMFESLALLEKGERFSIIELNGAGSEPTHMYDPAHSLWFAWKEIIRHWKILHRISTWLHRQQKVPYLTVRQGLRMFRDNNRVQEQLNKMQ